MQRGLLTWSQTVELDTYLFRSVMGNDDEYVKRMRAILYNISQHIILRPAPMHAFAIMSNSEMRRNTIMERVEIEQRQRRERFEKMLQKKYDSVTDEDSLLSCRKCSSTNIAWQQKQTRKMQPLACTLAR